MSHFLRPLVEDRGPASRQRGGVGAQEAGSDDRAASPQLLVIERTGNVVARQVETAFDSSSRRRGLLGRGGLADGHALVIAPCNAVHTVRMQFSIDILFVARDGRITKIVRRLGAWRAAMSLSAFATIELRGGALDDSPITVGDRLLVSSLLAPRPQRVA